MKLEEKFRFAAFELSCKSVFADFDGEDAPAILEWMASTDDTPLPEKFVIVQTYEVYTSTIKDLKHILATSAIALYNILVVGASLVMEEASVGELSLAELEEIVDTL